MVPFWLLMLEHTHQLLNIFTLKLSNYFHYFSFTIIILLCTIVETMCMEVNFIYLFISILYQLIMHKTLTPQDHYWFEFFFSLLLSFLKQFVKNLFISVASISYIHHRISIILTTKHNFYSIYTVLSIISLFLMLFLVRYTSNIFIAYYLQGLWFSGVMW